MHISYKSISLYIIHIHIITYTCNYVYVYKYIIYTSYVTFSSEGLSMCSKMNMFHYPVVIPFDGDRLVP